MILLQLSRWNEKAIDEGTLIADHALKCLRLRTTLHSAVHDGALVRQYHLLVVITRGERQLELVFGLATNALNLLDGLAIVVLVVHRATLIIVVNEEGLWDLRSDNFELHRWILERLADCPRGIPVKRRDGATVLGQFVQFLWLLAQILHASSIIAVVEGEDNVFATKTGPLTIDKAAHLDSLQSELFLFPPLLCIGAPVRVSRALDQN